MAYTAQNAVDFVKPFIKNIPVNVSGNAGGNQVDIVACDQVNSIIHSAYPWRWTLSALTPIAMVDGTQDYTIADASFYRLIRARYVQTNITPNEFRELDIVEFLGVELSQKGGLETIRKISPYVVSSSTYKVRLNKPPSIATGETFQIQGEYQYIPTKITALSAVLPWPDLYFSVFTEGLKWKFYQFADDDKAGSIQHTRNGLVRTGQMGVFYEALEQMRMAEDHGDGEPIIFPANPLGLTQNIPWGLFGVY